ncbi:MAG: tetratricopeptide repeat protein [Opitutaceae bacterium]
MYFEQGRLAQAAPILYGVAQQNPDNLDNRVNLALAFLASNQPDNARAEALAVLEQRPGDPQAPIILAESAVDAETRAEVQTTLTEVEARHGPTASIQVALATFAFRADDITSAAAAIAAALELDPDFAAAYSALGALEWSRGEKEAARVSLDRGAELSPTRSPRRIQYVRFLRQNGKAGEARTYLDQLIGSAPDYLPALTLSAELALAEDDLAAASDALGKALAREPNYPDALQLKGRLALIEKKPAEAIETFERMLALYPGNARIHHQLALACLSENNREKAIANLKQAVALAPDFNEAILLLAQLEIRTGAATDAVFSLQSLIEKQPELTQARILLADAYQAQGNLDGALAVYRDLAERFPDSPQGHLAEGLILVRQGNRSAARTAFEEALEVAPDYMPAAEQLINLDLAEPNAAAAETRARALVVSYPDRQESHFLLARILLAANRTDEAETSLKRAIAISPEVRTPQMLLVNLYLQTGRQDKALEQLETLIAQNANDVGALTLKAMIQQQKDDQAGARATYERILEINPDLMAALNNLAYLYSEKADELDRAFELAQRARQVAPKDPFTADTLGWIVLKRGDYPWAISLLQESANGLPNEPEVHYHLGMAHYMAGQTEAAAGSFNRAFELNPTFSGHEEAGIRQSVLAIDPITAGASEVAVLEGVIKGNPGDPVALTKLGRIREKKGDAAAAVEAYESALKANPDYVQALIGQARLEKDPKRGLEVARNAYRLAPDDPEVAATVGRLAYQAGEYTWAANVLQTAARAQPNNPAIAFDVARASYAVGQVAVAREQLERIVTKHRDSAQASDANALLSLIQLIDEPFQAVKELQRLDKLIAANTNNVPALMARAIAREYSGEPADAMADLRSALAVYPAFSPAKRHLALLMATDPVDVNAAFAMASEARQAFPQDPEVAAALGKLAYLKGDFRRALTLLGEATRAPSATAATWFYLGMSQVKSGDTAAGRASLERAMELGLAQPLRQEAEAALAAGS